jgi:hypothetical protein
MTIPAFQTVLKILAGSGPVPTARFVWGTPAAPFSVGSRGDWVVQAPGVESVHFFLAFDGRLIQASGLPSGPRVLLNGVPVEQNWTPVPVSSELTFGGARVSVLCEELVPESPAVPAAHCETKFIPDQPAPSPALAMGLGSNRTVALPNLQLGSWPPKDMGPPAAAARPEPQQPALLGFAPVPQVSRVLSPPQDVAVPGWPPAGPAQPAAAPKTQESEPLRAPGATGHRAALGFAGAVPPVAVPEPGHSYETVSDAGALRQQSSDLGSPPAQPIGALGSVKPSDTTQAGPTDATRLSADSPADLPVAGAVGGFGGPSAPQYAAPGGFGPPVPGGFAPPVPAQPPFAEQYGSVPPAGTNKLSPLVKVWKEMSWPKRAVLLALPFAAYFGLFYEPASEPDAATPQPQPSTAAAANAATAPSAEATSPAAAATAATAAPTAATAAAAAATAAAAAATAASASEPAAATAAPAESPPAKEMAAAQKKQVSAGRDEDAGSPAEREALNAAFEGRLADAADRYQQLASGADAQKFSLAARFSRAQDVRKP